MVETSSNPIDGYGKNEGAILPQSPAIGKPKPEQVHRFFLEK